MIVNYCKFAPEKLLSTNSLISSIVAAISIGSVTEGPFKLLKVKDLNIFCATFNISMPLLDGKWQYNIKEYFLLHYLQHAHVILTELR